MIFNELLDKISEIPRIETRVFKGDYIEIVVAPEGLVRLNVLLQSYFGLPFKPSGASPCNEARRYSEPYGGIQHGQTMYVRRNGNNAEIALLWPWGNGTTVTVKIVCEKTDVGDILSADQEKGATDEPCA